MIFIGCWVLPAFSGTVKARDGGRAAVVGQEGIVSWHQNEASTGHQKAKEGVTVVVQHPYHFFYIYLYVYIYIYHITFSYFFYSQ